MGFCFFSRIYFSLFVCGAVVFVFFLSMPSSVAQIYKEKAFLADPAYQAMVRQLNTYVPPGFDYGRFRLLYYQSSYYDPVGDELLEEIMELAYIIDTSKDEADVEKSLELYRRTVSMHLANLAVVAQAWSLSRKDQRFGRTEDLKAIRDGLLTDVIHSGTGEHLDSAYDVVTFAEETMLLHHLNIVLESTDSGHAGIVYYNLHRGTDRETGEKKLVFVNISMPMGYLKHQLEMRGGKMIVPKR